MLGGIPLNGIGTAQAQGPVGGGGTYPTTDNMPVTMVTIAHFPAVGLDPPYYLYSIGGAPGPDSTILRGQADATSPVVGQFPMAFMGAPLTR